jgi:hypothetical protein
MKRIILIFGLAFSLGLTVFTFSESRAGENPLIGTWSWDTNKTLQNLKIPVDGSSELKASATKAKKFVEAVAKKLGSKTTITYADEEYFQVIYDDKGNILSKESSPYKILETGRDFVIIDQMKNGGQAKIIFEDNSFFVEVHVGEYSYKDYFSKIQQNNEHPIK